MSKKEIIKDDGCGPLPESVFVEQYKGDGCGDEVFLSATNEVESAFDTRNNCESDFVVLGQYKLVRRVMVRKSAPKYIVRKV